MTELKTKVKNKPEFSRLFDVETLSESPESMKIKALKGECAALAKRFHVQDVKYLKAEFDLTKMSDGKVSMEGFYTSNVVQTCVVTLEPVVSHIKGEIDVVFCDAEEITRRDEALKKKMLAEEERKHQEKLKAKSGNRNCSGCGGDGDAEDVRSRNKRSRRVKKAQIEEAVSDDLFDDEGFLSMSFDNAEIEPINDDGGVIDLGEVIAQHLALEINPYPRKEGAVFQDPSPNKHAGEFGLTTSENPFAVLASLKDKH
ncbi:MAG: DUF177 domain-containing protein [Alphaproteobacteria bacterium]|nr:DUF177 domain-containing protein [Alphaproteobacteria bacterium]